MNLAEVLLLEGRIADARVLGQEALDDAREVRDQENIALSEAVLAHALASEDRSRESTTLYEDGLRIMREVHEPIELAGMLLDFGNDQIDQGELAEARKSFEEARALGEKFVFAKPEMQMAFARVSFASGQAGEASELARSAMNAFAAAGREGDRLQAAALLARTLIGRGNVREASEVLAQAPQGVGKSLPIVATVQFRIARSLLVASTGRRAEAARTIDAIAAEVSPLGLPLLEKETRLAREQVTRTTRVSANLSL